MKPMNASRAGLVLWALLSLLACGDTRLDAPWCTRVCSPHPVASCDWGSASGDKVTCAIPVGSSAQSGVDR